MTQRKKDIFLSYKNDAAGSNFAARLCADLEKCGYDVYYNPNEQHAGSFPDRLREAILSCNDFLLILTQSCLDQLKRHEKIDWVREEVLIARANGKNIIPLLLPGVTMPKDKQEMPEDLQFLPDQDALYMPEVYDKSPLEFLFVWLRSKPAHETLHGNAYNNSTARSIDEDLQAALSDPSGDSALLELANLYYFGLVGSEDGCIRDYAKCHAILEKLMLHNTECSMSAYSILAEMYYHGVVPRERQSYAKSFTYHEIAKSISGFSKRESAYLKSRGCGVDFDYNDIVEYYLEAIENGDAVAIMGLAKFYLKFGKYREAEALFLRSRQVLPEAHFQLGILHRDGVLQDPPKPDFLKAAHYFQRAIDSGYKDPEVYHQLGRLYFTPTEDFEKDFALAQRYFTIAADAGNKAAQYKLGLMYEFGYVEADVQKAVHYHQLAADQGESKSAYHLAMLYQNPACRDFHKAFENAKISAKKGIVEGEFLFAVFLYYGRGCEADEEQAYKYFCRAYEHGMYPAKIYLDKYEKNEAQ